jgi:predicted nucleic acid-binding protein
VLLHAHREEQPEHEPIRSRLEERISEQRPFGVPSLVFMCRRLRARANVVPDAYLAAMAIESDSDFVSTHRGFGGFPGLRWRHPLDP